MVGEIVGNTPVLVCENGLQSLVPARNLGPGRLVVAFNYATNKVEILPIESTETNWYKNYNLVTTDEGYTFKTAGGTLLIYGGKDPVLKRADFAVTGDHIAVLGTLPRLNSTIFVGKTRSRFEVNENTAAFLGMCLGNSSPNNQKIFPDSQWATNKIIGHLASSGSSWTLKQTIDKTVIKITGGILKSVAKSVGNSVPDYMYSVNQKIQLAFLSGYFMTAGKLFSHGNGEYYSATCMARESVRPGIITMMRQIGISPRIYTSGLVSLIEIRHKSLRSIVNIFKRYNSSTPQHLKSVKVRSIMEVQAPCDACTIKLQGGAALVSGEFGVIYG
jgi:hypothetical protein